MARECDPRRVLCSEDRTKGSTMRYTVRKSVVWVLGDIWMPSVQAAQTYELTDYDVRNARDDDGEITRDSVDRWLSMHSGDFASVTDFAASIEDGNATIEIQWQSEDNEMAYSNCFPEDED